MQCNVLVAYPYLCKMDVSTLSPQEGVRLLVDCGAFTAYKSGKEIRLDDYCRFLESLPFKPFGYFSLDVIGDPDKTTRNYQIMLERVFKPIHLARLHIVFGLNFFSRLDSDSIS